MDTECIILFIICSSQEHKEKWNKGNRNKKIIKKRHEKREQMIKFKSESFCTSSYHFSFSTTFRLKCHCLGTISGSWKNGNSWHSMPTTKPSTLGPGLPGTYFALLLGSILYKMRMEYEVMPKATSILKMLDSYREHGSGSQKQSLGKIPNVATHPSLINPSPDHHRVSEPEKFIPTF